MAGTGKVRPGCPGGLLTLHHAFISGFTYTPSVKRILALTALFGLLVSCTPRLAAPPAASVTGYWKGSISKYGLSVDISTRLQVTDSPASGDFTGKGTLRGVIAVDDAVVTGNVKTGSLIATDGTNTVTCAGAFKNNNEYNGTCTFQSYSAPLYMSRQGD